MSIAMKLIDTCSTADDTTAQVSQATCTKPVNRIGKTIEFTPLRISRMGTIGSVEPGDASSATASSLRRSLLRPQRCVETKLMRVLHKP